MQTSFLINARAIAVLALVAALAFTYVYPTTDHIASAAPDPSVCDRTDQIESAILAEIGSNVACEDVTDAQLAAITGINVGGDRAGSVMTGVKSGDLAGLTALGTFGAPNNRIGTIPADFFEDNTALTSIDLSVAQLTTLPEGLLDDLTSLATLRLERNYFMTFPPGLSATTMAKLTNLRTLTLGMDWPNSWGFQELPSSWVESLPDEMMELRLKHIRLSDADADHIADNMTQLNDFEADYQDLTFAKLIKLMGKLKDSSTTTEMDELKLTSAGDGLSQCVTQSDGKSLGTWYSESPGQISAFKTALSGLKVNTLVIYDATMTATVLEDILESIDKGAPNRIELECGQLAGFQGNALSGYTGLSRLRIAYSNLTVNDFKSIVLNLSDTPINHLELDRNPFDKGDSYIDLTQFDFSGVLDTLRNLSFAPYFSCEGPWVEDYHAAGFNLTEFPKTFVYPELPTGPVAVKPEPTEEPEECVEPVEPEFELQEEEQETEPNWPPATIMNIEPAVTAIRIWTGGRVVLTTEVYGVQGILDNDLADAVPPEEVWFDWVDESRNADFAESTNRPVRINNEPDDREVLYQVPTIPGNYRISVNVPFAAHCKGPRAEIDETMEEAIARCTAEFELIVRNPRDIDEEIPPPVNPSGPIPTSVTNIRGMSCPVFTPEEGGIFDEADHSVSADPGAIQNNTAVAICVEKLGTASNSGMTRQRYTLHGGLYSITAYDLNGRELSQYKFNFPIEACIPLPDELRTRMSDAYLTVINRDRSLTALQSTTAILQDEIRTCGSLGELPARIAIGVRGAPPPLPVEEVLPDTGGTAPSASWVILAMILGSAAIIVVPMAIRKSRRRSNRTSH